MKTAGEVVTASEREVTKKIFEASSRVIHVAPFKIMVNGYTIAGNYNDFKKWCNRSGLVSSMFENWPFVNRII